MTKEQLGTLILSHKDSLYRVAKTILKNDTDCEDAVSEAIVKSFSNIHTLKQDVYAKTWVTRILINECYRVLKLKSRECDYDEAVNAAEIAANNYSELYQSIMQLDVVHRTTIVLYYIEGYSIGEIGKIMGVSLGTVKSRLSRGRKKLKEIYDRD